MAGFTVKDLIAELEKMPPELPVRHFTYNADYYESMYMEIQRVWQADIAPPATREPCVLIN